MAASGVSTTTAPGHAPAATTRPIWPHCSDPGREDGLRTFHLLFRSESFVRQQGATTTFLEAALAGGRRYEEQVAQDLSGVVFERVFPGLVNALAAKNPERGLAEIRDAALIFLYRLLFVLYAEDRGLLPVNDRRYDDYGLRKRVRDDIGPQDGGRGYLLGHGNELLRPPWSISSKSSTWAMSPLACRPTTGVCSPPKPLPCWKSPAFPTPSSLPSSTR